MKTVTLQEWNTRNERIITVKFDESNNRVQRKSTAFIKFHKNGMATIVSERGGCGITTKQYYVISK